MDAQRPTLGLHRIRARFVGALKEGFPGDRFEFVVASPAADAEEMRELFQALADMAGPDIRGRMRFDLSTSQP